MLNYWIYCGFSGKLLATSWTFLGTEMMLFVCVQWLRSLCEPPQLIILYHTFCPFIFKDYQNNWNCVLLWFNLHLSVSVVSLSNVPWLPFVGRIGAGDGYSVFVSDSGMVMTCGDGTFGCLGHGDWNNSTRPRLIGEWINFSVRNCFLQRLICKISGNAFTFLMPILETRL